MSIPTHKQSCYTKAFPTRCPDCEDRVWFFSCSCGSKIYFEELGWPWPQHYCQKFRIREAIEMIRNIERFSDSEIYGLIDRYKEQHSHEVPDEVWEMLEFELGKRKKPFKWVEVSANNEQTLLSGQVMQINRSVNLYKKFHLNPESPFSDGLLGPLSGRVFHEVIIRENPNKENVSSQYTVLIDQQYFRRNTFRKSNKLLIEVNFIEIPPGSIWEVTGVQVC